MFDPVAPCCCLVDWCGAVLRACKRITMASSVLFYTSTQSTVSSSCPSSAASYLSRPTPTAAVVARAGCVNGCVAVYAAPSRALLDEHTRVAREVSRGDAAARAAAAAAVLDLDRLASWDQKAVFSELIKMSDLIQETYVEITSLCMQQPDLDTSFRSSFTSVYNALQSLTKISDISIAPHPDNLFVVLCMFKQLTDLFSLVKQTFLPIMEEIQSTEHINDDLSARFDPTLLAFSSTVRRTLELLEVWILGYDSEEVPHGGSVHEITRYLMTHINLMLEHGSLLAIVLNTCHDAGEAFPCATSRIKSMHTMNGIVGVLIHHLGTTLDKQSSRYQVAALQWLFLGNNMHFVLQQKEVLEMLGDDWALKHREKLGICISRYLDASWAPVLSCLETKSVMIPVCFKQPTLSRFSLKFEETYSTQKAWKIEDPLLRKHMRRAVIKKLMPTYRSYLEKHQQKALKLMKYTPEDLKQQLSDLFEG